MAELPTFLTFCRGQQKIKLSKTPNSLSGSYDERRYLCLEGSFAKFCLDGGGGAFHHVVKHRRVPVLDFIAKWRPITIGLRGQSSRRGNALFL